MLDDLIRDDFYEFPSFETALYSILLAFILSSVIGLTYRFTSRKAVFSRSFFQGMVLSSIASCMVIMAVGNNIAAGFGIIGAIAIIRFRMRIENPRNIIFMFAALSVGVASGVYGYSIALAGTVTFSFTAIILYYSPFGISNLVQSFNLKISVKKEEGPNDITIEIKKHVTECLFLSLDRSESRDRYSFHVVLNKGETIKSVLEKVSEIKGVGNVNIEASDNLERL
jgi:uncharacterized membrane protein YhiD involved in acid resistance